MKVAGMDECGRGALAGPLVAAGVVLKRRIEGLNDSKKLTGKERERLAKEIVESGAQVWVEEISVRQINSRGMGWANKEVFRKIIRKVEADRYIVDGNLKLGRVRGKSQRIRCVVRADQTRKVVMAAAIVAKVYRDELMVKLNTQHGVYGWARNKGYGTKDHVEALKGTGMTKQHRTGYVKTALENWK